MTATQPRPASVPTAETVLTLQFHYEIARALAVSATVEGAFSAVLEKIAAYGGWDAAATWFAQDLPTGPRYRWVGPGMASSALDDGAPIVATVLETGRPAWKSGACSALVFPLSNQGQTLGAIELIRHGPHSPDEHAQQIFAVLSQDIGRFLASRGADQPSWREVMYDRRTGLATLELLIDRGNQALLMAERTGHGLALAIIRLHPSGDVHAILPAVVESLGANLRAYDTVALLGRGELAVLFPALNAMDDTEALEEKIRALLPLIEHENPSTTLDATVRFARYPADGPDVASLLRHARG